MKTFILSIFIILAGFIGFVYINENLNSEIISPLKGTFIKVETSEEVSNESNGNLEISIPTKKTLSGGSHSFQTFNNCGPASLSMALSYYSINVSQNELGAQLRPYQIANGDNDDKSVTLYELAEASKQYDLIPIHRPNGNIELIKQFINLEIPIITRTFLEPNDDIGHYRVVKGFDDSKGILIQDDSLQGKDLKYSYDEFNILWKKFNYEYLVLIPSDKVKAVKQILGDEYDLKVAWKQAVKNAETQIETNPSDIYARFNLVVALVNINDFEKALVEYEKVETLLPKRTLWYQIEPINAYFETEQFDKVFTISDNILNNGNRAYTELYILRGKSYVQLGNIENAKKEFEKALFFNKNSTDAKKLLEAL